jgi:hypothetical protein
MFSSLFMVEGIATSVEVNFTKFSQTMVPTQCTVSISMYALYIGFARKNTFIYDNLVNSSKATKKQIAKDAEVSKKLDAALKQVNFEKTFFAEDEYGKSDGFRVQVNADRTDLFKKQIEQKELKNVRVRITIHAAFKTTGDQPPRDNKWIDKYWDPYPVTLDGVVDIPIDKITGSKDLKSDDLNNRLATEKGAGSASKKYISFRYKVVVVSEGSAGDVVAEKILYTDPVLSLKILDYGSNYFQEQSSLIADNNYPGTD